MNHKCLQTIFGSLSFKTHHSLCSVLRTMISLDMELDSVHNYELPNSITACLISICDKYASNSYPAVVFSDSYEYLTTIKLFLVTYTGPRLITSENSLEIYRGIYVLFYNILTCLECIVKPELLAQRASFVILMSNRINDTEQGIKDSLMMILNSFWKIKLIDVIILIIGDISIDVFTYYPYGIAHCNEVGEPVLLDQWLRSEEAFQSPRDLFPKDKMRNLYGCILQGIGKSRPPESIIMAGKNGTWTITGAGGYMQSVLQEKMNFTMAVSMPANESILDEFGYSAADGIPQQIAQNLHSGEKDLAFGIYSHIIYFLPGTEFTSILYTERFSWAVPCAAGPYRSYWDIYTREFTFVTWVLTGTAIAGAIILNIYMTIKSRNRKHKDATSVALTIYGISLGQSVGWRMEKLPNRKLTGLWMLYSLIMFSLYQAKLGAFMTVSWPDANIRNLDDILNMKFKVIGVPQSFNIFNKTTGGHRTAELIAKKFKKFKNGTFTSVIRDIVEERDTVAFGSQRFMMYYSEHRGNKIKSKEPLCLLEGWSIEASASPFLLRKGTALASPMNKIIKRMFESGIVNLLHKSTEPVPLRKGRGYKSITEYKLRLKKLYGALILYGLGVSISFMIFILEMFSQHRDLQQPAKKNYNGNNHAFVFKN